MCTTTKQERRTKYGEYDENVCYRRRSSRIAWSIQRISATAHEFLNAEQITNQMLLFFIDRIYVYSGMRIEIRYKFKDTLRKVLEP